MSGPRATASTDLDVNRDECYIFVIVDILIQSNFILLPSRLKLPTFWPGDHSRVRSEGCSAVQEGNV